MELIDRIVWLLFAAYMTLIVGDAYLSMYLKLKQPMSTSALLYGILASYMLVTLAFYSPTYLAACLLNLLGNFLATVTGASFPEVFYGSGYGYAGDAEAYCWYMLYWIWKDNAKTFACCVLSVLVPPFTFLTIRVWPWIFPSCPQRNPLMDIYTERMEARDLLAENRLIATYGYTEEEFERVMELAAGKDEASRSRLRSFVEEIAERREQEAAARREQERVRELREQRNLRLRRQARAADHNRRLREDMNMVHGRRMAELRQRAAELREDTARQSLAIAGFRENIARGQAEIAELQDRIAKERGGLDELRENIAQDQELVADSRGDVAQEEVSTAELQDRNASEHGRGAESEGDIVEVQEQAAE